MADEETTLFIGRLDKSYSIIVIISSQLPKPDQMRVYHDIHVELADHKVLVIPADFLTDCHSTPPWGQGLLPAYNNRTNLAAIVHDWLYMEWEQHLANYPDLSEHDGRTYADGIYLELMERFNKGRFLNMAYYRAVRLFGGWNWRKFRNMAKAGGPPAPWPDTA